MKYNILLRKSIENQKENNYLTNAKFKLLKIKKPIKQSLDLMIPKFN